MGYQLSVDLGTTYTAAAMSRDGRVEMVSLGTTGVVIPSVVLLRADGEVLVGEAAVRRGIEEPTRVAREFKRRVGDPTPMVLGGTPYGAEALMAHLLRWVVKTVSDREGAPPDRVVLTHPANYGPYKLDMMREVARSAGLDLGSTLFVTEPQAAAISYAIRNRVEPGAVIAVYDFGGGTFDAALLQRSDHGFVLLGRPEGMDRFGGIDIDSAVLAHVDQQLDGCVRELDPDDPHVTSAVARLKDECRAAKETLATDTDTSIEVSVPGKQTRVRLTRRELEDMVRPRLAETIDTLGRAVTSAGLIMEQVSRILLVGGSSRMPLVGETLQRETGRPVAIDAHPKFAIALGAATYGGATTNAIPLPEAVQAAKPTAAKQDMVTPTQVPAAGVASLADRSVDPSGTSDRFQPSPAPVAAQSSRRKVAIAATAALLIGGGVFVATRGGDDAKSAAKPVVSNPPAANGSGTVAQSPTHLRCRRYPSLQYPIRWRQRRQDPEMHHQLSTLERSPSAFRFTIKGRPGPLARSR